MTTFTTSINQIESLYVGYFGRAGDPAGTNYWIGLLNAGTVTLSQIAASFSIQPESTAKYPYLANPNINDPGVFVDQVYQNMFNHVADAAGKAYWVAQLTAAAGNPSAIGAMILNIISGAVGTDATIITNKVDVANDFTTKAANAGTTWTEGSNAQSSAEIATVTDSAASVTAAKAATDVYIATAPGPQDNFTLGIDTLTQSALNANFNAPLIFNAPGGALVQSLQIGDSAIDTAPLTGPGLSNGGTFTATLGLALGVVPLVTLKGIPTHSVTDVSAAVAAGYNGDITGLVTFNNNASTNGAGLTIGAAGNGIDKGGVAGTTTTGATLLSTVNINNVTTAGASTSIIVNTAALAGAADALAINLTGNFGTSTTSNFVSVHNDTAATAAAANTYETLNIAASGATFLALADATAGNTSGILSTTTINVTGAGATTLFGAIAENFSKVTTIDASKQTGGVTITGVQAAGVTGLLEGNTVLSSFKGGTGNDSLDITSMTAAQVQAFAAGNLDGGTGTDTLMLTAATTGAANTTVTLNNTGFENIGLTTPTGTIDFSKLGTGVTTLSFLSETGGALVINNMTSGLTVAAGLFGDALDTLALNAAGAGLADAVTLTHTADVSGFNATTVAGFENITHTVATSGTVGSAIAAFTASASIGGAVTYNLADNSANTLTFTAGPNVGGNGSIIITGTGIGGVTFGSTSTVGTVNASGLNTGAAATTVGLTMTGGTSSATSVLGSNGRDILITSAAVDALNGGTGDDDLTGLASADAITTGTGIDNVFYTAAAQGGNTTTVGATALTAGDVISDFVSQTDIVNVISAGAAGNATATGAAGTWNITTNGGFIITGSSLDFVASTTTSAAVGAAIGAVTSGNGDRAYVAILDTQGTAPVTDDVYNIFEVVTGGVHTANVLVATDTISLIGTVNSATFVVADLVVT